MKSTEKSALEVLLQMKDCIDNDSTYTTVLGQSFNLTRQHGICWHVFVHTADPRIKLEFLKPVFEKMGLDQLYPIERQLTTDDLSAKNLFWSQRNMYDLESEAGKLRYKLLVDLIEYYQNILVPETI